jgi:hypothetical protein
MAEVKLVLPLGVDDHVRPPDRRVNRFVPPLTQVALWLFNDGRVEAVVVRDRLPDETDVDVPDDVAGGGHDWYGDESSWQVALLTEAGYNFETVPGA